MFEQLRRRLNGELLVGQYDRGRYATDASFYQIMPQAVAIPSVADDLDACLDFAREQGLPITMRGGGTSQSGQTVGSGLIVDCSKNLNQILELDLEQRQCVVEPGIVLSELNRQLKPHGLWYPVDVSTATRATIGGMTGNNSCGSRSLKYGIMRNNVLAIDALLTNGDAQRFDHSQSFSRSGLDDIGARFANDVARHFPKVQRRVGGYNLDALVPSATRKYDDVLLGSEGTLAISKAITLKLWPLPTNKVLGVCHFPTFHAAMDAAQHLVKLKPVAIELVDENMIRLGRDIPLFRQTMDQVVRGNPAALLLVEFAEDDQAENLRRLKQLHEAMGTLGFDWSNENERQGGVVDAIEPAFQKSIWDVRTQGLNIMMSMKEAGKPVSFIEDCAVPLEHLADYTSQLNEVFGRYNTSGTWYAHASEGTLHVRPVLNLKLDKDVTTMRSIAEEAFELVRNYKGAHSGEHGDGLVRSEFHRSMYGDRLIEGFEEIKSLFDPNGLLNPGKIVNPSRMDNRSLFRYHDGYETTDKASALDWQGFPNGLQGAVEMCNNNGACRKFDAGVMCPSYRVTKDERDVVRGRANSLRLALSGQLGADALASDEMAETMALCVGCKACQRECPTGVDMARMKIEVDAARYEASGLTVFQRLVASMPRYARSMSRIAPLANIANRLGLQRLVGFAAKRPLPSWQTKPFGKSGVFGPTDGPLVVLFVDSFNRAFEPSVVDDALSSLVAVGYRVFVPKAVRKPLCCGKTELAAGRVGKAREIATNLVATFKPHLEQGARIVGLEPSCTLSLLDELPAMLPHDPTVQLLQDRVMLYSQAIAERLDKVALKSVGQRALLHGHCHEKAKARLDPTLQVLGAIDGLETTLIDSSCCGMAGSFGYAAKTADVSRQMAELSLLPSIRADEDAIVIANGTSCRHQIADGTGRPAKHLATIVNQAVNQALS